MTASPPSYPDLFSLEDLRLLSCFIVAHNQEEAAEWLGCSSTHLRRRLKQLRSELGVETNQQLLVLASGSGAIDLDKVLPPGNILDVHNGVWLAGGRFSDEEGSR